MESGEFLNGISHSLIDKSINYNGDYNIDVISNYNDEILNHIKKELVECDEFIFAVAFVTKDGFDLIKKEIKNKKGLIITGNYLNFTQPSALTDIISFRYVKSYMCFDIMLHTKGYYFRKGNKWNLYIGSSNLTYNALRKNNELLSKVTCFDKGELMSSIFLDINNLIDQSHILDFQLIEFYSKYYKKQIEKFSSIEEVQLEKVSFQKNKINFFEYIESHDLREVINFLERKDSFNKISDQIDNLNFLFQKKVEAKIIVLGILSFGTPYYERRILEYANEFSKDITISEIKNILNDLEENELIESHGSLVNVNELKYKKKWNKDLNEYINKIFLKMFKE